MEIGRVAPEWGGCPVCPADLFNTGMPLGRWRLSNGTEKDWEALLGGRPLYQQKVLGTTITPEETRPLHLRNSFNGITRLDCFAEEIRFLKGSSSVTNTLSYTHRY